MKEQFMYGAVTGAIGFAGQSGWMTANIFVKVLQHIQKYTSCNTENKILIIMDNHETHISLEAILYSRANGIVLLSFPPHCTHQMQPLDKAIFGPFKSRIKKSFNDYILNNPGKPITIYEIAKLSADPYLQSFSINNIVNSFSSTGIWPINSLVYTADDILPSSVSDNLLLQDFSNNHVEPDNESPDPICSVDDEASLIVQSILDELIEKATERKVNIISVVTLKPSDIRPYPHAGPRKINRTRKSGKSRIYTSTPEKDRLEELEKMRKVKLDTQNAKRNLEKLKPVPKPDCQEATLNKKSKPRNKKKLTKRKLLAETSSSESDIELPKNIIKRKKGDGLSDSDCNEDFERDNDLESLLEDTPIRVNDFLLIKFSTKKRVLYYIGQVTETCDEQEYAINFLRKSKHNGFTFPAITDTALVSRSDIVAKLPTPIPSAGTSRQASQFRFDVNLFNYNVQ